MTPEQYQRASELFLEARKRGVSDVDAFLDERCDDDVVRNRVRDMLSHDETPAVNFESPALGERFNLHNIADHTNASREETPERIGHYHILGVLGEGGMGTVYRAEQERPQRVVALKVIRSGLITEQMRRRFELEVQVLGRLQHPGIAQIFEAGMVEEGRRRQPYFAMELIEGRSLTAFARERSLGTRDRLALIEKVGEAVQHAHMKGVVHRDLKPSNIVVNADAVPKVLDFGVARATDSDVQTTTLRTDIGQLVGTLAYMSPEQVTGDAHRLDTRSDVYSLGVIAYELVTGRMPYDLKGKTLPEAIRIIGDRDPTPPSTANAVCRGDLETVLAKALEKTPERRYQSAGDFIADLRRYLNDEPIVARPPSISYQFSKFARRNRALMAGVSAALIALVLGLVGTTWGFLVARDQRDHAEHAKTLAQAERDRAVAAEAVAEKQRAEAEAARDEASRQADIAQAVNQFLNNDLLAMANPFKQEQTDVSLKDMLDLAASGIENRFTDQPLVRASIMKTLGTTYTALAEYEKADRYLTEARDLRLQALDPNHPAVLDILHELSELYTSQGRYGEALEFSNRVLKARLDANGPDHYDTLVTVARQGVVQAHLSRFDEAERLYLRAIRGLERIVEGDEAGLLSTKFNLANLYLRRSRWKEAEPLLVDVLAVFREKHGSLHPKTLNTVSSLARLYQELGQLEIAESLYVEALRVTEWVGPDHPRSLKAKGELGYLYMRQARYDEAEPLFKDVLKGRTRVLGAEHPNTLRAADNLASLYLEDDRPEDAAVLREKTLDVARRVLGNDHTVTMTCAGNLANDLMVLNRFDEAEPLMREALDGCKRLYGPAHLQVFNMTYNFAAFYERQERYQEAESLYAEALVIADRTLPENHWRRALILCGHGKCLFMAGRFEEAERVILEGHELFRKGLGIDHSMTRFSIERAVEMYEAWEKPAEVAQWNDKLNTNDGRRSASSNNP